jgi:diguanylate cyclase (GGDEF)-like protein/PAS domain S-box-containing protein
MCLFPGRALPCGIPGQLPVNYGIKRRFVFMMECGDTVRVTNERRRNDEAGPALEPTAEVAAAWAHRLVEEVPDLVCLCCDGVIVYVNAAGCRFLGVVSAEALVGRPFVDFVHPENRRAVADLLRDPAPTAGRLMFKVVRPRGGETVAEVLAMAAEEGSGGTHVMVHARDVTDRLRAEDELSLATQVIEATSEGVLVCDTDFRVISVNMAFTEITGYVAAEAIGESAHALAALDQDEQLLERMSTAVGGKGRWEGELRNQRKNGEEFAERVIVFAITDETGAVRRNVILLSDITKRKMDEEHIRYQANFDILTGLPNRALFLDRLDQALSNMERVRRKLGLLFIDLDGFKLVNDTLGHAMGDILLREASRRLQECVRGGDTVARLGGDEFMVIMPNLRRSRNAPDLAQRILDALARPFDLEGYEAFVSGSIGITVFPDDAKSAADLLKNADGAMYQAKEKGRANYQFFTANLNEEVKERLTLKNGLSKALERGELSLHYQPKLEIQGNRITGVEALMRWHNEELGQVSPGRFIPVLEDTGLVVGVGEWAIRTACEQHRTWLEAGLPSIRIAVNLSARQVRERDFVSMVGRILRETNVGPEGLEIEITESMLMTDADNAVQALGELHDMGISVAMDDFGTGYSSLSYLKRFPIDTIKIDQSFVADIAVDPDDAEIINTIISMGRTLNRKVVAEGVETEEQLSILREYRCDEIQGYFFSRPQPAEQLTEFLKANIGRK